MHNRSQIFTRLLIPFILLIIFSLQLQAQPGNPGSNGRVPQNVRNVIQNEGQAQVIVSLRDPGKSAEHRMTEDEIAALQQHTRADLETSGFQTRRSYSGIPALAGVMNANAIQALENNPNVVFVMLDVPMQTDGNGREGVGVLAAHANGFTGQGVTVAVIDTGINESHMAYDGLEGAIVGEYCATQGACYPFGDDAGDSAADKGAFGHGTVVADIIGGPGGYAPDVNLVPVRVLDDDGGGYLSDWLAGLDWVWGHHVDYSIDVVNMSLGTVANFDLVTVGGGHLKSTGCDADNELFADVADVLVDLRNAYIPVFVASGNFAARPSGGIDQLPAPACFSDVIAVAATYSEDYGRFPFSGSYATASPGFPPCHDQFTDLDKVACFSSLPADIAAPGVHTVDIGGQEAIIFGTSFASPAAAGIAAMVKQQPATSVLNQPTSVSDLLLKMQTTGTPTFVNEDPAGSDPALHPPLLNARNLTASIRITQCDYEIPAGDVYGAAGLFNAINGANAASMPLQPPILICLAPGATYQLTTSMGSTGTGLPTITGKIAILGRGATIRRADGAPDFRIFAMDSSQQAGVSSLYLTNLTLENGSVSGSGGAIYVPDEPSNNGTVLELIGVTLRNNRAATEGGAIYIRESTANLHTNNTAFIGNESRWGGAMYLAELNNMDIETTLFDQNSATTDGGAIFFQAPSVAVSGSVFTNNIAAQAGGAIVLTSPGGAVDAAIKYSRFEDNLAFGGGAIHSVDPNINLSIYFQTKFIRNVGLFLGGAISQIGAGSQLFVDNVTFIGNAVSEATASDGGGAIYIKDGSAEIMNSEFEGNSSSSFGAALFSSGSTMNVHEVTFADQVPSLGTVYADDENNVNPSTLDMVNATIVGRALTSDLYQETVVFRMTNTTANISFSTFINNGLFEAGLSSVANLKHLLMVNTGCHPSASGDTNVFGFIIQAWSPGVAANNCPNAEVYTDWDPTNPAADPLLLGPLADNGGFTRTVSIAQDSVAANRIIPANCTTVGTEPVTFDQRFEARDDLRCDVGAFEYVLPTPQDVFDDAKDNILRGFDEYGFDDDVIVDPEGEDFACGGTPAEGDPYHLSVSGQSIFRGLAAGQSIFRGLASGGVFMDVETGDGDYDQGGIYTGDDPGNLDEVDCIDGQAVLEIPGDLAEDEVPFRIVLWNELGGSNLKLNITDITFKGCGLINGISPSECEALLQFYYDTGVNAKYWLDTDRACQFIDGVPIPGGWSGVECENRHVTALNVSANLPSPYTNNMDYFDFLNTPPEGDGIVVTTTSMTEMDDGLCSLIEAVITANNNSDYLGCSPADGDYDLITLLEGHVYQMTAPYDPVQEIGLPAIIDSLTIVGNNARIERSFAPGTPAFRLMLITNGAKVVLDDMTLRNGHAALGIPQGGGAIVVDAGSNLTISNVNFVRNRAETEGGALMCHSGTTCRINSAIFWNNVSLGDGGAIVTNGGTLQVYRSAFLNNQGHGEGGAIYFASPVAGLVQNSTFSGNSAGFAGAAVGGRGAVSNPVLEFKFVTFAENVARDGWGVMEFNGLAQPMTTTFTGVLTANNEGINCGKLGAVTLISNGYNISDEGSCDAQGFFTGVSDLNNIDPLLGPLESRRPVHIPMLGSPALDRVPAADCTMTGDQLGLKDLFGNDRRPQGAGCDVGAFEWFNRAPTVVDDEYNAEYQGILAVNPEDGVLANDSDADENAIYVIDADPLDPDIDPISPPTHAKTFELYSNGGFIYEPEDDFNGEDDSFIYEASDGVATTQGTVVIHVAPMPLTSPDHLGVVEANAGVVGGTAPVFPTLRFTHRQKQSDTEVPGIWYQILLGRDDGTVILRVWLQSDVFCEGLICEVPLDQTYTPEANITLPINGLVNDDYKWWVRGWSGPNQFSPWSTRHEFTVNAPLPSVPVISDVQVGNGVPTIIWGADLQAMFFRVRLRNAANTIIFEKWFHRDSVCPLNSATCSMQPDVGLGQGDYWASVRAWGPGGGTTFSAEYPFTQVSTVPAKLDLADMTVLYPNSGRPIFQWPQVTNATFYNIILYDPVNKVAIKNEWYKMVDICQNSLCTVQPSVNLKNGNYSWWFRSWGPAGFNNNDPSATGYTSDDLIVAAADPIGTPVLVVPANGGSVDTLTPIYSWERVTDASWFRVEVKLNNTLVVGKWVLAADVGCGHGDSAAYCLYQPDIPLTNGATYSWNVRAYSPAGTGAWSWDPNGTPVEFTVAVP